MDYIKNAIKVIQNNMHSYILFLFVQFLPFLIESFRHAGEKKSFLYSASWIIVSGISLFLVSGIYYHFVREKSSQQEYFSELYLASKKYFFRILAITLWIGLVAVVLIFILIFALKFVVGFTDGSNASANIVLFNILKTSIILMASIYFFYSIPSVYSHNLSVNQAISISFKFLRSNLLISIPIIILLGLSIAISSLAIQIAIDFEYRSISYWIIMCANNIFTKSIYLLALITAVLVLKDHFFASNYIKNI